MNRILLCTSAIGAALLHASVAQAQGTTGPATQVSEVIVTGEKFERTLQETTTSVAVTTSERIAQESLVSLQDIYNRTANISETYGSAGFTMAWAPEVISRRLRMASGALLLMAAGIHVLQHAGGPVDPVAWIVDASLAGLGVLSIVSTLTRQRASAGEPAAAKA